MFTQNEEEWKETNELGSSEYRRRMTHEDICHCDDERQFALQSVSQQWQKSTDYCGGFSDYMTLFPLRLWLRNDLKRRNQQRRCHSFKSCYRNLQRYRGYNHSETIQNRRKYLDTTDHQYAKNSENLRTVRVIPMKFVSKLATKDSTDFQVDKASDSNNLPFHYNESRKALDVPYYGPFRARKIKITPSMKFRKTRPMASVSKLATKNSPDFQIDNATDSNDVPIDINESRKASDVPYYGPFRARLLKIVPAIKTKKYRSIKEYYLSEMEYLHEIPNEKSEISENPVIVKETHDKSTDSRIVSDTYDNTISKHICSEFDEIPLFMPTKIDGQTSSLPTIPKIDDLTNSLSTIPKIDGQTNSLSTIPKIEHKLSPELLPLYSHEILTDYTIQPLVDRKDAKFGTFPASQIFHISGKTENRHEEQDRSLENATTSVERITSAPEESSKKESSLYSGRKRETITAEVYIRNPKNLKPTIINISDSNKKPKKPCWMILKIYESPSRKFDEDVSKQNFDKGIIRIRSDPTISKKFEKLETKNFSETTSNIPSAIADIPKMKQDASERIQTKTLISSDSELQSKMNLTVKTQIDTSIKSKIITSVSQCIRNR